MRAWVFVAALLATVGALASGCPSWPVERPLCDRAGLRCCLPDTNDGGVARFCTGGLSCSAAGVCQATATMCHQPGLPCCLSTVEGSGPYCNDGLACMGGTCTQRNQGCGGGGCDMTRAVDLLIVVDNSISMTERQVAFTQMLSNALGYFVDPPRDSATGRQLYPPATSLQAAVISTDLGTPGSIVPGCANPDAGDDGLLNPTRNGAAMHMHPPWANAPTGSRPTACQNDPNQFPAFLGFSPERNEFRTFAEGMQCTAYLSTAGCGLGQPLEAIYRALAVHDARGRAGSNDPNAGFLREGAALAIVVLTDGEDGSVRDCRFAESGVACSDALPVFDVTDSRWSSSDLSQRFYMYTPGSAQDPTWPLDRYLDPNDPRRGLLGLKPVGGRIVFGAITGVPLTLPARTSMGASAVDWDALLGTREDGSDGYVGMSAEGTVSMRQRNLDNCSAVDPACAAGPRPGCISRVVPGCRREGSARTTSCSPAAQYYALPARRIASLVRRFDELHRTDAPRTAGVLGSICANDITAPLREVARLTLTP